jgi:hypothetical protein
MAETGFTIGTSPSLQFRRLSPIRLAKRSIELAGGDFVQGVVTNRVQYR